MALAATLDNKKRIVLGVLDNATYDFRIGKGVTLVEGCGRPMQNPSNSWFGIAR